MATKPPLNSVAAILSALVELLKSVIPAFAAYMAGKSRAQTAVREADAEAVERAKAVADSVGQLNDDTVLRWMRHKYAKRNVLSDSKPDIH